MSQEPKDALSPRVEYDTDGMKYTFLRTRNRRGAECRVCDRRWSPPAADSIPISQLHEYRLFRGLCGKCHERLVYANVSEDQLREVLREE